MFPDATTGGVWVTYPNVTADLLEKLVAYASSVRRNPTGWMARMKYSHENQSVTLRIFPTQSLAAVLAQENWLGG